MDAKPKGDMALALFMFNDHAQGLALLEEQLVRLAMAARDDGIYLEVEASLSYLKAVKREADALVELMHQAASPADLERFREIAFSRIGRRRAEERKLLLARYPASEIVQ